MAHPHSWEDMDKRLYQLYPKDEERAKVRAHLFRLDVTTASSYFQPDAAVKASLDTFLTKGVPVPLSQYVPTIQRLYPRVDDRREIYRKLLLLDAAEAARASKTSCH